ncbi:ferredoxin [Jannaschia marina]|uniref:ferredoxin n=1 Tax=Jannaschia marina TaxID=2741674 RepID=UPI0015C7822F|nr:ferredoxin [Jannaschia marina]
MTTWAALDTAARSRALIPLGGFDANGGTTVLLGPDPATFWSALRSAPESGGPHPVDAWSRRVVGELAAALGAEARFPFTRPLQPFVTWATKTGRCHISPVGLLVHDTQGLMVSFRGALVFGHALPLPPAPPSPCDSCAAPCLTACPVGALGPAGYDLHACHGWLDDPANDCMARGCAVRRVCPVSPARPDAQSAHHMAHFHRRER